MGQDHIDRHIKSSLSDHNTYIDTDELWGAISKKQRSSRLWFIAALVLLGLILGSGIWTWSMYNNGKTSGNSTENYKRDFAIEGASAGDAIVSDLPVNTEKTKESFSKNKPVINQADYGNNKSQKTEKARNRKISHKKAIPNDGINYNVVDSKMQFKDNKTKKSEKKKAWEAKSIINHTKQKSGKGIAAIKPGVLKNDQGISDVNLSYKRISKPEVIQSSTLKINRGSFAPESIQMKTTECPNFGGRKSRLFVEAYSMLDYVRHSYSAPQDFEGYLSERQSTQSYQPSYRAGVQLKYLFNNGIFLKSGIEYARARERFRYRKETIRTEIRPDQVIHVHVDTNGDTTVILGNAPVTIIETKNWRVANTYTSLDIPLSVGYQVEKGPWFYSAEIGVLLNISYGFSGMLLDTSGEPVDGSSWFVNTSPLSFSTALSLGYRLTDRMNFIARASVRNQFSRVNNDLNTIDQKYTTIGAGIGLEYEF